MKVCNYGHVRPESEEDCGECQRRRCNQYYRDNGEALRAKARARYAAGKAEATANKKKLAEAEALIQKLTNR